MGPTWGWMPFSTVVLRFSSVQFSKVHYIWMSVPRDLSFPSQFEGNLHPWKLPTCMSQGRRSFSDCHEPRKGSGRDVRYSTAVQSCVDCMLGLSTTRTGLESVTWITSMSQSEAVDRVVALPSAIVIGRGVLIVMCPPDLPRQDSGGRTHSISRPFDSLTNRPDADGWSISPVTLWLSAGGSLFYTHCSPRNPKRKTHLGRGGRLVCTLGTEGN